MSLSVRLLHSAVRSATYKSVYNLENLYPNSPKIYGGVAQTFSDDSSSQKFTGDIPIEKMKIKYTRASGPGGQNVNKVSTKAEVRFNVHSADWIPDELKPKILEKYKKKISSAGDLIVTADDSRYQMRNLKSCLEKIREYIFEVQKPPDPRKELEKEKLYNMDSIHAAHRKRLQKKRMKSYTKSMRNSGID